MERRLPDITRTKLGRDVVEVLAFGCIQFMLEHGLPLAEEGFERLVARSRETGLNGRIAFQMYDWTQRRLQELFAARSGIPVGEASDGVARRLRARRSIRMRLLAQGLGEGEGALPPERQQALLAQWRERLGDDVADILEALRCGECQRDLVWGRIAAIAAQGDVAAKLAAFRGE